MSHIDVLIGNSLPLYREVLASTFRAMRPDLAVCSVDHEDLERHVLENRPRLVICSAISAVIIDHAAAWILLFPDDRDEALVSVAGARRTIPHASVIQLLDVMDELSAHPEG